MKRFLPECSARVTLLPRKLKKSYLLISPQLLHGVRIAALVAHPYFTFEGRWLTRGTGFHQMWALLNALKCVRGTLR